MLLIPCLSWCWPTPHCTSTCSDLHWPSCSLSKTVSSCFLLKDRFGDIWVRALRRNLWATKMSGLTGSDALSWYCNQATCVTKGLWHHVANPQNQWNDFGINSFREAWAQVATDMHIISIGALPVQCQTSMYTSVSNNLSHHRLVHAAVHGWAAWKHLAMQSYM